ncbi:MAG TPA: hypothetical protein VGX76_00860 [Pirellulales bacterium]|nr:hypothetical protein [Pirellulales bacterium]
MRASPALWLLATFCFLNAAGCQSGSKPNVWPWNKNTPPYSTWSKTPPPAVSQQPNTNLPSVQAGGLPATNGPNAGYPAQTAGTGAVGPNGYPAGAAAPAGGYGQPYDQTAAGANQAYGGAAGGQGATQYDRTADARYGNSNANPAAGSGYGTGSRYDAPPAAGADRYGNWAGDQFTAPAEQNAVLGDRYSQPSTGAASVGAPAGTANQPNSAWPSSNSNSPAAAGGYPTRGATPGQTYRGTSNDVKPADWRPGGTSNYAGASNAAPTRAAFNSGAGDAGAQAASYNLNSSRYGDGGSGADGSDLGYDTSAVGDRYGQPAATTGGHGQGAATTAGGYGQDQGPVRR